MPGLWSNTFFQHFETLEDPRIERTRLHQFGDILFIALCAMICGADHFTEMERFGLAKQDWLKKYLELPNGIPSHDVFRNVFCALNPDHFGECFSSWVSALDISTEGKIVSIDGKTSRASGSARQGKKALHMVTAWVEANRFALGQVATAEKTNEITAIPKLLEMLELHGAIVTLDPMGCQKAIAAQIREKKADYVLQVKGNQDHLETDIMEQFADMDEASEFERSQRKVSVHEKRETGHGRTEYRRYETMPAPKTLRNAEAWKDLKSIGRATRVFTQNAQETSEVRYYITSLAANAAQVSGPIRKHWGVENGLHWVLDMAFEDDRSTARTDHAPTNLGILRRWTLSLLAQDQSLKGGIKSKRKQLGWNVGYLEQILNLE